VCSLIRNIIITETFYVSESIIHLSSVVVWLFRESISSERQVWTTECQSSCLLESPTVKVWVVLTGRVVIGFIIFENDGWIRSLEELCGRGGLVLGHHVDGFFAESLFFKLKAVIFYDIKIIECLFGNLRGSLKLDLNLLHQARWATEIQLFFLEIHFFVK